jgi:two-component system, OmpR family, alkaline phosphatase synthesis response regulator PhoP
LSKVFIIANESEPIRKLKTDLAQTGLDCLVIPQNYEVNKQIGGQSPDLLLVDVDEAATGSEIQELAQKIGQERHIPIVALLPREKLNGFDFSASIDDFVVKPWEAIEVMTRIKRVLRQKESTDGQDIIRCGDLVIDSAKCEVSLGSKPIILTFKEYQLLRFLANNKGKVFTREALLNKVWGWDYYGGDRTVDVHIRRLRSKIEDINHSFIETIRNIGYRFAAP